MAPSGWTMLLIMIVAFVVFSGCVFIGVVARPVPDRPSSRTSLLWPW